MSAANIDRAIKAIEEVVQAALNGQAGMGTLRPDWILERLCPLLADLAQEHSDAMELRLENKGLRRDREALALGIIPAPVSELAALREQLAVAKVFIKGAEERIRPLEQENIRLRNAITLAIVASAGGESRDDTRRML